jgi:hypothetical protein
MQRKFSSRLLCTGFQIYVQIIGDFHTKCNIGSPVVLLRAVDVPQGESSGSDVPPRLHKSRLQRRTVDEIHLHATKQLHDVNKLLASEDYGWGRLPSARC